jgi:hypothetical protein
MRRILVTVVALLILIAAGGGCQDRGKDAIPTQVEPAPKEQPRPAGEPDRP